MSIVGSGVVDYSCVYDKIPEETTHTMDVEAYAQFGGEKLWKLGSGSTTFEISNFLIGHIDIEQKGTREKAIKKRIVATKEPVNFTFILEDPGHFFANFDKTFQWKINGKTVEKEDKSTLIYTFDTSEDNASISVYASVISKDKKMDKHVDLTYDIKIMEKIEKLNTVGKFFISRNQSLDLNISCVSGSPPFFFCKEITKGEVHPSDCKQTWISSNACSFHAAWYFKTPGKYNLSIRVTNEISESSDRIELSVLDITKQPTLIFVILPVVCCILAIVIIVFAIAFHVQQRKRFTIEVADFDFQARDENLMEKTFYERVRDSFSLSMTGMSFCRTRSDSNDDHDDLPPQDPGLMTEDADDGYASTSVHINTWWGTKTSQERIGLYWTPFEGEISTDNIVYVLRL